MADTISAEDRSLIDEALAARPPVALPDDPRINRDAVDNYLKANRRFFDLAAIVRIIGMAETGESFRDIAANVEASPQSVRRLLYAIAPDIAADVARRAIKKRNRENVDRMRENRISPNKPPASPPAAPPRINRKDNPALWALGRMPAVLAKCRVKPITETQALMAIGTVAAEMKPPQGDAAVEAALRMARVGRRVKA